MGEEGHALEVAGAGVETRADEDGVVPVVPESGKYPQAESGSRTKVAATAHDSRPHLKPESSRIWINYARVRVTVNSVA